MNGEKAYTGIDSFRLAAAFLVVAIHTSPLSQISGTADFVLTRIIARTAVPFFFMTSGFFLISSQDCGTEKLVRFVKKTALIYGGAIVLYLPVNIYAHSLDAECLLGTLVKHLAFEGTMYHLWYLPASMAGAAISWYLVQKLGMKRAFLVSVLLYIVGLFGDSYYGFIENIPVLSRFYGGIFAVSGYTRNGIFFAPVFFILGGIAREKGRRVPASRAAAAFLTAFALMLAEGLALRRLGVQRHDSMYVMLLPCMFFLFAFLLHWRGKRMKAARDIALFVYIIHPMCIIAVRLFAKITHLQAVLTENAVVHFLAVCAVSALVSVAAAFVFHRFSRKKPERGAASRAWIEIDRNNLLHNVKTLQKAMPEGCELMAVVKADAYGHGASAITACISGAGVNAFAVATVYEGITLRKRGLKGEILILGYTPPERARELKKYDLTQTLISYEYAVTLNSIGKRVKCHVKIDTGMKRLGIDPKRCADIAGIYNMKNLDVCGIYTHLCAADSLSEEDTAFTLEQIRRFYHLLGRLKKDGIDTGKIHIQSSYGLWNYPKLRCDYIRTGVALYGVMSGMDDKVRFQLDLRPVLSLKSCIVHIQEVKKGETAGYKRAFVAEKDSRLAIVPAGYADGVPRSFSCGKGTVLIRGQRASVAGMVCMDQLAIDVTDVPGVSLGDTVTLIGIDGEEELTAPEAAAMSSSISNELLSRLGTRLDTVWKDR